MPKPAPLLAFRRSRTFDSTIGTRLIARARPQALPKLSPCRWRHGPKGQQFHSGIRHTLDAEHVAGHRLPRHQGAKIASEVVRFRRAARLAVQVSEVELPAVRLPAGVLANQAVQPAFDTAGEPEIRRVVSR